MEKKLDEEFKSYPKNRDLLVSQYGTVKTRDGKILEKRKTSNNKYYIIDDPQKIKKYLLVHRLVAHTWCNDTYIKGKRMVVHHIDFDSLNNHADNLAWLNECIHLAAFHGMSLQCEECDKQECEYRYYFQTPPVGDIITE